MGQSELRCSRPIRGRRHAEKRQRDAPITNGKLDADRITFTAGGKEYTGVVKGNAMEGTAGGTAWQATKQ